MAVHILIKPSWLINNEIKIEVTDRPNYIYFIIK